MVLRGDPPFFSTIVFCQKSSCFPAAGFSGNGIGDGSPMVGWLVPVSPNELAGWFVVLQVARGIATGAAAHALGAACLVTEPEAMGGLP